jgi:hypothetical protein
MPSIGSASTPFASSAETITARLRSAFTEPMLDRITFRGAYRGMPETFISKRYSEQPESECEGAGVGVAQVWLRTTTGSGCRHLPSASVTRKEPLCNCSTPARPLGVVVDDEQFLKSTQLVPSRSIAFNSIVIFRGSLAAPIAAPGPAAPSVESHGVVSWKKQGWDRGRLTG